MKYLIYLCENIVTGKVYIGQTKQSLEERRRKHFVAAFSKTRKTNYKFHNTIRKYGIDAFKWTILQDGIEQDMIDEIEIYYIAKYDSFNNGYNSTLGGFGNKGYKHTEETKLKISEKAKLRLNSDEFKLKISESRIKRLEDKKKVKKPINKVIKPVYQYDKEGNFIQSYESATFAARIIGGQRSKISNCCNGKRKHHKGFIWSFTELDAATVVPLV